MRYKHYISMQKRIVSVICVSFDTASQNLTDATNITNASSRAADQQRRHIDPSDFVKGIDNPYFPLVPGTSFYYVQVFQEGNHSAVENIKIDVTYDTKVILGVCCEVVHDVVKEKGTLIEDTYDWYAQDKQGNVWYFGEDTKKLVNGTWVTTGSWEGGVNGAVPGLIMLAHPEQHIGQIYRQEYLKDSAEDKAKVISVNSTNTIQLGTYANCVVTEETTRLDPGVIENKYYAPGIGNISTILNVGGEEHEELVKITYP